MSTRKFPGNFKNYLLDMVSEIYCEEREEGEDGEDGIPNVEAILETLEKDGANIRRESMPLQVFFAWCLGPDVSDKHNELSYIEKFVGNLPTGRNASSPAYIRPISPGATLMGCATSRTR